MKITVKVKPNSRHEKVEYGADGIYLVQVNTPPIEGRANFRAQELLATYFKVAKSSVILLKGGKSKIKLFEIAL